MVARKRRARSRQVLLVALSLVLVAALAASIDQIAPVHAAPSATAASAAPAWQGWATSINGRKIFPISDGASGATVGITVDPSDQRQKWLGTGASLTDAAVTLIQAAPDALAQLYDPTRADGAHLNLLRLPLTATDLSDPT